MIDASLYYEQQVDGLGDIFLDKIELAVQEIAENPARWPVIYSNIRRRLIHRFPYGLYYRDDQDEIVISLSRTSIGINLLDRTGFDLYPLPTLNL